MPLIAALGVDPRVTGLAQGDEVLSIMRSTIGQRDFMVDFLGRNQDTFGLAQLAHRMLKVSVCCHYNYLPHSAVKFISKICVTYV